MIKVRQTIWVIAIIRFILLIKYANWPELELYYQLKVLYHFILQVIYFSAIPNSQKCFIVQFYGLFNYQ